MPHSSMHAATATGAGDVRTCDPHPWAVHPARVDRVPQLYVAAELVVEADGVGGGVLVVGVAIVELLHLYMEGLGVVLAGDGGAREAAVKAEHGCGRLAAARLAALEHLGDDADAGELAVGAGEEEDAVLIADVDRQRGGDGREDDCLVERDQEIGHARSTFCS